MEEKKAREAKCQPLFSFKTKIPDPVVRKEAEVVLPFNYKPPTRLLHRKKIAVTLQPSVPPPPVKIASPYVSATRYGFGGSHLNGTLKKATSCSKLTMGKNKKEEFYSCIPANMGHLGGPSTSQSDNSIFTSRRKFRTSGHRDWNRHENATKSIFY